MEPYTALYLLAFQEESEKEQEDKREREYNHKSDTTNSVVKDETEATTAERLDN